MRERKTKVRLKQCSNARVGHSLLPVPGAEPLGGAAAPSGNGAGLVISQVEGGRIVRP